MSISSFVQCQFTIYCDFSLPKGVVLLSVDDNSKSENNNKPFTWYIKHATLYYLDANLVWQEVDGEMHEVDAKYPKEGSVEITNEPDYE